MKYRKKPVVIDAVQWTGENQDEISEFIGIAYADAGDYFYSPLNKLCIHTLEGILTADIGDWVIKGIRGEFYPCKPDIFAETYEPVDES